MPDNKLKSLLAEGNNDFCKTTNPFDNFLNDLQLIQVVNEELERNQLYYDIALNLSKTAWYGINLYTSPYYFSALSLAKSVNVTSFANEYNYAIRILEFGHLTKLANGVPTSLTNVKCINNVVKVLFVNTLIKIQDVTKQENEYEFIDGIKYGVYKTLASAIFLQGSEKIFASATGAFFYGKDVVNKALFTSIKYVLEKHGFKIKDKENPPHGMAMKVVKDFCKTYAICNKPTKAIKDHYEKYLAFEIINSTEISPKIMAILDVNGIEFFNNSSLVNQIYNNTTENFVDNGVPTMINSISIENLRLINKTTSAIPYIIETAVNYAGDFVNAIVGGIKTTFNPSMEIVVLTTGPIALDVFACSYEGICQNIVFSSHNEVLMCNYGLNIN